MSQPETLSHCPHSRCGVNALLRYDRLQLARAPKREALEVEREVDERDAFGQQRLAHGTPLVLATQEQHATARPGEFATPVSSEPQQM